MAPIGNYTNATLNLPANQTIFINITEANTTLELASSQNVSGAINAVVTTIPLDVPYLGAPSIDKYIKIDASESIMNNLSYVVIKLYYTEEEIIASGIEEGSLGFYWWNQTSSSWEKLTSEMDWVYETGVNTLENYVWANLSHFSDYSVGGLRTPPAIELNRDMPLEVETNKKFNVKLRLNNLADFRLFNISIQEKIPMGYRLREDQKIIPKPQYIGNDSDSVVIYWNINKLESHTNILFEYSLYAPKSIGNYTFRTNAFGFDVFNNKYAGFNVTTQKVKKPTLLTSILEIFGF